MDRRLDHCRRKTTGLAAGVESRGDVVRVLVQADAPGKNGERQEHSCLVHAVHEDELHPPLFRYPMYSGPVELAVRRNEFIASFA